MKNQARFATLAAVGAGLATIGIPAALQADVVYADDVIISKDLCVGSASCVSGRSFSGDLEVTGNPANIILFDNAAGADDWEIEANSDNLTLKNRLSGGGITSVFRLNGGARSNSLVVDSQGRIGVGTSTPFRELHVTDSDTPTLRLDQVSAVFQDQTWDIAGNELGLTVRDVTNGNKALFVIEDNAPGNSLYIENTGNIGMGTSSPDQVLHIKHTGHILPLFETTNGGAIQMRMKSSSSNRRFVALNGANVVQSQIVFGDNGQFDFLGQTVADVRMSIDATGNLTVPGTCRDGNGGGGGADGCDAVFDPSYELPSIEEHAAYMWRHKHLPAIGPTPEGKRISLSVQQRHFAVLNELEKAHIYIEQLHEEAQQKDVRMAALEKTVQDVLGRLAALESR